MTVPAIVEGYVPYSPATAGKPCQTWFKTVGNMQSGVRPLVIVHGGPGLSHDYLLSLMDLASAPHNIPLIFYDQIGNGRSTRLPEKLRDYAFWNEQLFLDELTAVLVHLGIDGEYDLLGHSWGGMLGSTHAARQPLGLRRLILAGTPVSSTAWCTAYYRYRDQMSTEYREILERPIGFDEQETPEYKEAMAKFMHKHMFGQDPYPSEVTKSFEYGEQDPTVILSTLGPSEFEYVGFTLCWSVANELHKIKVPTLLINGTDEGADDDSLRMMNNGIRGSRWIKFESSHHMPHYEERQRFMESVAEFLKA